MKKLIITAALITAALITPATAQAAPASRICYVWQNTCVRYVWIFGRPICTAHALTCIKWL